MTQFTTFHFSISNTPTKNVIAKLLNIMRRIATSASVILSFFVRVSRIQTLANIHQRPKTTTVKRGVDKDIRNRSRTVMLEAHCIL